MVTDFLGNEIKPGDYFAYPLTAGRSANMAIFQFVQANASGTYKARPVERSYSYSSSTRYKKWEWNADEATGRWRDLTPEERAKVDAKTSTLHFLEKRAVLLKDFKEEQ